MLERLAGREQECLQSVVLGLGEFLPQRLTKVLAQSLFTDNRAVRRDGCQQNLRKLYLAVATQRSCYPRWP